MPKENRSASAIGGAPALIAEQASLNPAAIAISGGRENLSYGELNQRSNRLAHLLRSRGVSRDVAVGVYLDRSPGMVVATLAVLKAGGAFLPLDPAQPAARLGLMLKDSDARVLLSTAAMAERLPAGSWELIALDRDAAKIAAQAQDEPGDTAGADDLAYIIYTSGSTGEPKGVEVPHRGLSNLVAWHRRAFQVTSEDRASSLAALGFDAAVWEIWPYLCAGATVFLADERVRSDAPALRDWMVSRGITVAFAPTAMAENLLALEWPQSTALRYLLTGADVLKQYPRPGLPFVLVNNYGPTESTVVTTSGAVKAGNAAGGAPSIGRAIDGVQVYLLDEQRKPVAQGAEGEIYIGGESLARGYRNRPEMTAQRFVPNPFGGESGSRLYRTGDLARQLPSGEIVFLGRIDEQVKIRGYRVEPGEIATILGQHESVRSAVVAVDDASGGKELVAYLVPAPGKSLSASKLRDFLLERLPEYMAPSAYVEIPSLPLTTNGKLDRAALPSPNGNRLRDQAHSEPRTLVEEELVRILAPLLKLERVGVDDNFFLLGGHSLLGTQLIARVSESFGVDLTLLKLFDHPTVAGMAEEIEDLILAKVVADSAQPSAKLAPAF